MRHDWFPRSAWLTATALAFLASAEAPAQEAALLNLLEQEETVITASMRPEKLATAPSPMNVVTEEDIRRSGATSIPEAMRRVPGVVLSNMAGGSSSFWVRMMRSNTGQNSKILGLLNGVYMNEIWNPNILWEALPVDLLEIKRIELVKGPSSIFYGANAFAGTVNVITKTPEEINGVQTNFRGGNKDYYTASALMGKRLGDWSYKTALSLFNVGDWAEVPSNYKQGPEQAHELKAMFQLNRRFGDDAALEAEFRHSEEMRHRQIQSPAAREMTGPFSYFKLAGNYKSARLLSYYNLDRQYQFDAKSAPAGKPMHLDLFGFEAHHSFTPPVPGPGEHRLNWGGSFRGDKTKPGFAFKEPHERTFHGTYVNDEYKPFERLTLNAGGRYDKYPKFDFWSPRFGAVAELHPSHYLRLSYSEGFRAPSLFENHRNFVSGGNNQIGDPNLKPEKVTSYDVGYLFKVQPKLEGQVAVFDSLYKNFIESKVIPGLKNQYFNLTQRIRTRGLETSLRAYLLDFLRLQTSYTYQDSRDDDTDAHIISPPRNLFHAGLAYTRGPWKADLDVFTASELHMTAGITNPYTLVNAYAGYEVREGLEVYAAAMNLLDKTFRDTVMSSSGKITSEPISGVRFNLGVSYRFSPS